MWPFNPKEIKTEEQIHADRRKWLDKAIIRSANLKKLILDNQTGWIEYIRLIDEYIQAVKKRKVATSLDYAEEKVIYELKLLDHEINILEWAKQVPAQFINNVEELLKKEKEEENGKEIKIEGGEKQNG